MPSDVLTSFYIKRSSIWVFIRDLFFLKSEKHFEEKEDMLINSELKKKMSTVYSIFV